MMLLREFREACRRLARGPGYALLSVAVLGVGLGVALAVFSMVKAVVLQPYPFPQAERLMVVGQSLRRGVGDIDSAQYLALRGSLRSADAAGAYGQARVSINNGAGAQSHPAGRVTASLLPLLGAKPLLGRLFVAADDDVDAAPVVLLGESLWRREFHADPEIVGRAVKVDGHYATVVGVLPENFRFPPAVDLWLPLRLRPGEHRSVRMLVRLALTSGLPRARAELDTWRARLKRLLPPQQQSEPLTIAPLSWAFTPSDLRHWVWLMFGAGLLVLLLACINVANLQLVRTLRRRHELALRSALGSSRARLMTGVLIESLLLSTAALLPAFAITRGATRWLNATWVAAHPASIPYNHGIDAWVIAFAVLVALFSTAVAGGIPAWRASRAGQSAALRDGSKGSSGGMARMTRTLVVAEVALTVVLLVGAGMFVGALDSLLSRPAVGASHAQHVLTARVALPAAGHSDDGARIRFFEGLAERLRQAPGVIAATAANTVPSAVLGSHEQVSRPGRSKPVDGWPWVQMGIVDARFLETYDVKLLKGRFFDARDRADSRAVIVIDQRMARAFWPHGHALQQQLLLYPGKDYARTVTVVGVTQSLILDTPLNWVVPGMLMPLTQAAGQSPLASVGVAVRTRAPAADFSRRLDQLVHSVNPGAAVFAVRTQARAMAIQRMGLTVLTNVFTALGLVALLLAAAGLYGVLAFSVAQRTREIGIRRAIGADNGVIARSVGRQLAWQLGLGLAIGLALAAPWSSLLAAPSLGTQAYDPAVFVPVVLLVLGVAAVAALVPLLRALRVDPAVALRDQ